MERICMTVLQLANGDDDAADEAAVAPFETPPFEFDFEFEFCFVDGDDNDDVGILVLRYFPDIFMFVLLLSSSDL